MKKGLVAAGIAAIAAGVILIILAGTVFTETVVLYGRVLTTANSILLYSGVGLVLVGILLLILSPVKLRRSPSEVRREAARAKAEEETDVIKILKKSFRSLIDQPGFFILYLMPFTVALVAFIHFCLSVGTWTPLTMSEPSSEASTLINFVKGWAPWIVVYGIVYVITMLISEAAIILKAAVLKRGKNLGPEEALPKGIGRVPSLFAAYFLFGAIVCWPLLLLLGAVWLGPSTVLLLVLTVVFLVWLLPMIYISIRLALLAQACVLENLGPVACLRRSWHLTKGNFWLIFVMSLLLWIVSVVVGLIPVIGSLVAMVLVGPAGIIAYTLIYLGLRKTRKR